MFAMAQITVLPRV